MTVVTEDRRTVALTVLLTTCTFIYGIMSRGFGLTLACMVNITAISHANLTTRDTAVFHTYPGEYVWDVHMQAHLVASYGWGALVTLPLTGLVVTPWNAVNVVSILIAFTSSAIALFPVVTKTAGYPGAVTIRVLTGIFNSFIGPAIDQTVASHIPRKWKTLAYAFVAIGSYISAVVSNATGGYFCSISFLGGWPVVFYVSAIFGGFWIVIWNMFCRWKRDLIFDQELLERKPHSPSSAKLKQLSGYFSGIFSRLPGFWREVGRTPAFWSLMPCVAAATWTTSLLLNYIPSFYRDTLRIPINTNGILSALPFIVVIAGIFLFSFLADYLKQVPEPEGRFLKFFLRPGVTSKFLNTFGLGMSGLVISLSTFLPDITPGGAAALLATGAGLYTACYPGYRINIVTLSRRWASMVAAVATFVGTVAGIVFPYVQSAVVQNGDVVEWRTLFMAIVVVDMISVAIFVFFGPHHDYVQSEDGLAGENGVVLLKVREERDDKD